MLAAGAARRFGGGKLCIELNGRPLIAWSVSAALATRVARVTVILGNDADRVGSAISSLHQTRLRLRLRFCAGWSEGLSASLRCAVSSVPNDARALLIFLGDMPHVSSTLADKLLDSVLKGAPAAIPEWQGQPGHPVAIAAELFPLLDALEGDVGAAQFLRSLPDVVRIKSDDCGAVTDIDEPADLRTLDESRLPQRPIF